MIIEGQIAGSIAHHKKHLTIGKQGRVKADIHASSVIVLGNLVGDIHSDGMVSLAKGCEVAGNIYCGRIVLEEGARFKGAIDMGDRPKIAALPDDQESADLRTHAPLVMATPKVKANTQESPESGIGCPRRGFSSGRSLHEQQKGLLMRGSFFDIEPGSTRRSDISASLGGNSRFAMAFRGAKVKGGLYFKGQGIDGIFRQFWVVNKSPRNLTSSSNLSQFAFAVILIQFTRMSVLAPL